MLRSSICPTILRKRSGPNRCNPSCMNCFLVIPNGARTRRSILCSSEASYARSTALMASAHDGVPSSAPSSPLMWSLNSANMVGSPEYRQCHELATSVAILTSRDSTELASSESKKSVTATIALAIDDIAAMATVMEPCSLPGRSSVVIGRFWNGRSGRETGRNGWRTGCRYSSRGGTREGAGSPGRTREGRVIATSPNHGSYLLLRNPSRIDP